MPSKIPLQEIKSTLGNLYMDDLSINITLADIHQETQTPSLVPNPKQPFKSLSIRQQAAQLTVAKTQWVLSVLDFLWFKSNDLAIQHIFN